MWFKIALRSLIPPLIWEAAVLWLKPKERIYRNFFEGPFASWDEASKHSEGWNNEHINSKTLESARLVRDQKALCEQDAVVKSQIPYSSTILAFLLAAKAEREGILNIVDFGGGLGTGYFQYRDLLHHIGIKSIRWNVVERSTIVNIGLREFQTQELRFFNSLNEALSASKSTAVIFTGSIQYVKNWSDLLHDAAQSARIIAFDRVLVSPSPSNSVFIQNPDPSTYYPAGFPVWRFSKKLLVAAVVKYSFSLAADMPHDATAAFDHCGMIFVRSSKS